jgi:hypothetical protein
MVAGEKRSTTGLSVRLFKDPMPIRQGRSGSSIGSTLEPEIQGNRARMDREARPVVDEAVDDVHREADEGPASALQCRAACRRLASASGISRRTRHI